MGYFILLQQTPPKRFWQIFTMKTGGSCSRLLQKFLPMFRVDDFPKLPRSISWGEMFFENFLGEYLVVFLHGFFCQVTGAILVAILQWPCGFSTAIHGYIRNLEISEVGPSLVTKVAKAGCISPQMPGIHEKSQIWCIWILIWEFAPPEKLTKKPYQPALLQMMMFLFPRSDMLVPWRVITFLGWIVYSGSSWATVRHREWSHCSAHKWCYIAPSMHHRDLRTTLRYNTVDGRNTAPPGMHKTL